jgi:hypothetical protein
MKCGAVHCSTITREPANLLNDHETTEINYNWSQLYLATQLIPFDGTAQDFTHVLASVSSLDLLKEELVRLQRPQVWMVCRGIYVVHRE